MRTTTGTLYEPRSRVSIGKLGVIFVVLALISALWFFRAPLLGLLEDQPEVVLILVDTEPSDARVYVDEVLQPSHSIQLPRSDRTFAVRVSKEGYLSKTVRITADRTRMLRLVLRRPRH